MSDRVIENVIEWIVNDKIATVTLSQKKYINKVKRLAEKYPEEVKIEWENADGSIVAHLPVNAISFQIHPKTPGQLPPWMSKEEDDEA